MDEFKKEGAAALMHVVMIGSNEHDRVMIGAANPAMLRKAVADLLGRRVADKEIARVAVCDAEMAGLLQAEGVAQ